MVSMGDKMKTPSIKTLSRVFDNPKLAKSILTMRQSELRVHPVGAARIAECYSMPKWCDIRMTILNSIDDGLHGVESCEAANGEYCDYLNPGDSYAPTVIFWRGNYRVQSLGGFIETMERQSVTFK
jgi:hypothetical protein